MEQAEVVLMSVFNWFAMYKILTGLSDDDGFPPSMPCTSTGQAEDELLDMLTYDTVLSTLRSDSSSGFLLRVRP